MITQRAVEKQPIAPISHPHPISDETAKLFLILLRNGRTITLYDSSRWPWGK